MGPSILKDSLYNVEELVQWGGTLGVCAIVFVETGLFVGFFLPGDSLLVTAGIIAAAGQSKSAPFASVRSTLRHRRRPTRLLDRPPHGAKASITDPTRASSSANISKRAHAFYEHHGGKTVILARFIPIIRSFCPPVAGAARKYPYVRYLTYDIFGGIFWVSSTILLGYFLGRAIPNIDRQLHWK